MRLPTRPLGTSGLEITTVGFGAWATGGGGWAFSWGPQDDDASIAAMRRAVEHGVNWIDTAAVYGLGHSEEVVGRFLRQCPAQDRPLVFTKCGRVWDEHNRMAEAVSILSPSSIRRECEASLRRLGVERIDLYQFHWPDKSGVPVEDSWDTMTRLVEEGKVRLAGVSNFDVALLARCEALRHVDSYQPPFSIIRRDAAAAGIPWCAAHGTGVICYSPMQSGLLTDGFSRERLAPSERSTEASEGACREVRRGEAPRLAASQASRPTRPERGDEAPSEGACRGVRRGEAPRLANDDWRRRSPYFQEPQLTRNLALRDALKPIAARHGTGVGPVAIAWTLAWPGVTGAIVGARSPEQVDGWVAGGTLELTPEDLADIARAIEATGAGSGPVSWVHREAHEGPS